MSDQAEKLRQKMMILKDPLKEMSFVSIFEVQPDAEGALFSFNLATSLSLTGNRPFLLGVERESSFNEQWSDLLHADRVKSGELRDEGLVVENHLQSKSGIPLFLAALPDEALVYKEMLNQVGSYLLKQTERPVPFLVSQSARTVPFIDEIDKASFILMITKGEPHDLVEAYTLIKKIHLVEKELPIGIVVTRVSSMKEGAQAFETLQSVSTRFLDRQLVSCGAVTNERAIRDADSTKSIHEKTIELIYKMGRPSLIKG